MPLLLASISALYSSLVELQGSNHGRSGEGDITRQLTLMLTRKRAGCNNSFVNPLNGDAALKLKMWIFTDFHPVLLQVGVEMLYLLAILGGFWTHNQVSRVLNFTGKYSTPSMDELFRKLLAFLMLATQSLTIPNLSQSWSRFSLIFSCQGLTSESPTSLQPSLALFPGRIWSGTMGYTWQLWLWLVPLEK